MALYKFSAISIDGKKKSGKTEANGIAHLRTLLGDEGLFLLDAKETVKENRQSKLKLPEVADFCRQLAAMLSSGITLIRAMMIISQRDAKPHVKKVYEELIGELQRGSSLSEAMSKQGKAFPELLINMMKAGESSGRIDTTAEKMAVTYDKEHKLNTKVRNAAIYPAILLVLIILVVFVVFIFVLPTFFEMFEGMELPLPTRIVMGMSDFMVENWLYIIIVALVIVAVIQALFRIKSISIWKDKVKLKIPKVGKLLSIIYTSRFARTMASLYVSGIPMIQSLTIARKTIGNKYIDKQFDDVIQALGNGRTLSQSLLDVEGFDSKLKSTIMVGEESGRLEQMLESIADQFDYEAEMATQRLVTMIEPIMIVIMAAVVAFVMISVMMPIYQMYGSIEA